MYLRPFGKLSSTRFNTIAREANSRKVLLLFGPTGVGKTQLLQELFSGSAEVISADSLQVYRKLDIGTAKPSPQLRQNIPHHLIDILDFQESFNVGAFCREADYWVKDIASRGLLPIISGGTAYYMKAWLLGMPKTPQVDPLIRQQVYDQWGAKELKALHRELMGIDPQSAKRIEKNDRYRMLRALEVYQQSGKPLSEFPVPNQPRQDYETLCIGLRRSRTELHQRIIARTNAMFAAGLEQEVAMLRALGADSRAPGMKGIGYKEWFEAPKLRINQIKELIIRNTRRYAKRQMTFFNSIPGGKWVDIAENANVAPSILQLLKESGINPSFP